MPRVVFVALYGLAGLVFAGGQTFAFHAAGRN